MKRRKPREPRKGHIVIIPMIDVMLFLLVTFILASLSMQNLNSLKVNLPEGNAEPLASPTPVTLVITEDGKIYINHTPVYLQDLAASLKPVLHGQQDLIVSADNAAPQGIVVEAMLQARAAGAQHFLIAVKRE
jgi:biopolymer transport protein ExbD